MKLETYIYNPSYILEDSVPVLIWNLSWSNKDFHKSISIYVTRKDFFDTDLRDNLDFITLILNINVILCL